MVLPRFLILFITHLLISHSSELSAQLQVFTDLQSAKEAAKNLAKHLIILRTDFETIKRSVEVDYPTPEWCVDKLLKGENLQHELKDDFVIFTFDSRVADSDNQRVILEDYKYDYLPNMIILDHNQKPIAYLELSQANLESDLNAMIRSSIDKFQPEVDEAAKLESKFSKKIISSEELIKLIQHRDNLSLSSKKYLNYLAVNNMMLPRENEYGENPIHGEHYSVEDPFYRYYMNNPSIRTDLKIVFGTQLKDVCMSRNDVKTYHKLIPLLDSLMEKSYDDSYSEGLLGDVFPKSLYLDNSRQTLESISFYAKNEALELLRETSEAFIEQLISNYEVQKMEQVAASISMLELLKPSIIDHLIAADTTQSFNWEKYVEVESKKAAIGQDKFISSSLNEIAWVYFQHVISEADLKKAIDWCQKSLELHPRKENNDTMAHLHFKLGNKDLAIYYQSLAVSLAEAEGLPKEYIQRYKDQLEKFKGE